MRNIVSLPNEQFKLADGFRNASYGSLYVGKANTDPTVVSNQIQVQGELEDGSTVTIAQPVALNANGYPVTADGKLIKLGVDSDFSVAIFDAYGKLQISKNSVANIDTNRFIKNMASTDDFGGAGLSGFDPRKQYSIATAGKFLKNKFNEAQQLEYWYDITGNWDDAWLAAQYAVYKYGLSPKITFPNRVLSFTKPLIHGPALGDWIHKTYPSENFYDSTTGNYKKTWPCIIEGVYRKFSDGGLTDGNGTQIVFTGASSRTDETFMNSAIIYCAPTEQEQLRRTATVTKHWPAYAKISNVNISSRNQDSLSHSLIHGIYIYNGTQVLIDNVTCFQVNGGGIIIDWTWDSMIRNCKVLQCGRTSKGLYQFVTDNNLDNTFQTYAPIHVMRSASNSDNSNFIRIYDTQLEDNYNATTDIIVSGNSSPVWLKNLHFECDDYAGAGKAGTKECVASARGVSYFGQDGETGFDYTKMSRTNSGGYIDWSGGAMYSSNYNSLITLGWYSGCVLSNLRFPNTGNITIIGANAASYLTAVNCSLGNITLRSGNSSKTPLILDSCDCGDITADYTFGLRLNNTSAKNVSITNQFNDITAPFVFSECTFNKISAQIKYAMGRIITTSTTDANNFLVTHGDVDIVYDAWYMNQIGANL